MKYESVKPAFFSAASLDLVLIYQLLDVATSENSLRIKPPNLSVRHEIVHTTQKATSITQNHFLSVSIITQIYISLRLNY